MNSTSCSKGEKTTAGQNIIILSTDIIKYEFTMNSFEKFRMWGIATIKRDSLMVLIMTIFVIWLKVALFSSTLTWQAIDLVAMFPTERNTCGVSNEEEPNDEKYTKLKSKIDKFKIGILSVFEDSSSTHKALNPSVHWTPEMTSRLIANRNEYAAKHGYQVIIGTDVIDHNYPVAWSKFIAIEKHMKDLDYIVYMDLDIVIMNMDTKLEDIILYSILHGEIDDPFAYEVKPTEKSASIMTQKSYDLPDIIMTNDRNGPNTGVFFIKNTDWSKWLVTEAFSWAKRMSHLTSEDGIRYPFEYEQRALHYLLYTDVWSKRKLPMYKDYKSVREHFIYVPPCKMNVYNVPPFFKVTKEARFEQQYVDGDFLIHFAGYKGRVKINLLNHFLDRTEKMNDYKFVK